MPKILLEDESWSYKNLHKRIFSIVQNHNHKVITILGVKISFKSFNSNIRVNGFNNEIVLVQDGEKKRLGDFSKIQGFKISINGNNNKIILEYPLNNVQNNVITINGNDNFFKLSNSIYPIHNACFSMQIWGKNRKIIVGKNFSIASGLIFLEEDDSEVLIGEDCMFSHNLFIRNSDGHVILDKDKQIVNQVKTLEIGNHVWIAAYSTILKNSKIADGSIVGANSVITKRYLESNIVIAGNPAKVVKKDITWDRRNMNTYIYEQEVGGANVC